MKFVGVLTFLLLLQQGLSAILGIDYGQEFTKGALVGPSVNFEIILTVDSKRKDVSGLAITNIPGTDSIQRSYGSSAISTCIKQPHACLMNLKSLLGKSVDDRSTTHYLKRNPSSKVIDSGSKRKTVSFQLGTDDSGKFPVEEIVAMSLEDLKTRAEEHLSYAVPGSYITVDDTVITVPGFFDQAQRNAIIDSAKIAGLNVLSLIDDGIAIALNYASSRTFEETKQYHLIYDMGAGSTKATLVSFSTNDTQLIVEEEGYGYDEQLGGQLFTETIRDILMSKFLSKYPKIKESQLLANHKAMNRLWQSSEKAKTVLSANVETSVSIESFYNDIDFKTVVTREEFEEYNTDHMERITKPILQSIASSNGLQLNNLTSVILAGGSTRIPFVQRHLNSLVGEEANISKNVNADEAAVMGATLRGVHISGILKNKDIKLIEKSGKNFMIKYGSGKDVADRLVFTKNDSIPLTSYIDMSHLANTTKDITVELYEDGELYSECSFSLGKKFNSSCPGGLTYAGKLTADGNKLFQIDNIAALCFPEFDFSDFESKNITQDMMHDLLKPNKTVMVPKNLKYPGYSPMSNAIRSKSINRLNELSKEDMKRAVRSEMINNLEGSLYDLRGYIEDDEDVVANGPPNMIKEAREKIAEYLEWLDYELDESVKLKDIEKKYDDIRVLKIKIESYLRVGEKLLTREAMSDLAEKAGKTMYDIQEFMLVMSEDAESIRTNFTEAKVNFEEANKAVKVKNVEEIKENEVNELFETLNMILDELEPNLKDDKIFEEFSKDREGLFSRREVLSDKVNDLTKILRNLKSVHKQRITALNSQLAKVLKKRERKAAKASKSEAEAELESQNETTSASSSTSTSTTTTTTTASNSHDEL